MEQVTRISASPEVMGGRPCIRGMRVTVGTIVGLVAAGRSKEEILDLYPYTDRTQITPPKISQSDPSDESDESDRQCTPLAARPAGLSGLASCGGGGVPAA